MRLASGLGCRRPPGCPSPLQSPSGSLPHVPRLSSNVMTAKLPLPQPPVLVAGLGRAGEAALELLTRTFGAHAIFAWDAKQSGDVRIRAMHWRARGVRALLGGDGTDAIRAV